MHVDRLKRREFIAGALSVGTAWPAAVVAQQPTPVVGVLSVGSPKNEMTSSLLAVLRQGLADLGFVGGKNVSFEYRFAEQHYDRLLALASELVQRRVAVIATSGTPAAPAAKAATQSIPIVFIFAGDPVAAGLVGSFSRPGHNVTGISFVIGELGAKRVELLHELAADAKTIGVLVNRANPVGAAELSDFEDSAHKLGVQIEILSATNDADLQQISETFPKERVGALLVGSDPFLVSSREKVVALAAKYRVPALYPLREFVEAGGLASYGASLSEAYRQAANYIARILRGTSPGDLPVVQAARIGLVINQKTARSLGIVIPLAFIARADEVIE
jgi:putative tryptophan/tyrosine transport system substrate-binding protein